MVVWIFNLSTWGKGRADCCEFEARLIKIEFQASQCYRETPPQNKT